MADRPSQGHLLQPVRATEGDQGRRPRAVRPWSFACERAAIRRLDRAFQAFLPTRECRTEAGLPAVQGTWLVGLDRVAAEKGGARWDSVPHPKAHPRLPYGHRPCPRPPAPAVKGRVKTITAKREGDRWYVVLSCDDVPAEPLEPTGSAVGIDLGVASFLTTSTARTSRTRATSRRPRGGSPPPSGTSHARKRGSRRRKKTAAKVARLHGKVRRQRLDHAHKTALALVRDHDLIVHEDLRSPT